jgi:pimeloyl-ACP methyl ester carboxylesterase
MGERDPTLPFASLDRMSEYVPDLRANLWIEGAGHRLQQERPNEVNAALIAFLRGL